jgi:hypothetical protein
MRRAYSPCPLAGGRAESHTSTRIRTSGPHGRLDNVRLPKTSSGMKNPPWEGTTPTHHSYTVAAILRDRPTAGVPGGDMRTRATRRGRGEAGGGAAQGAGGNNVAVLSGGDGSASAPRAPEEDGVGAWRRNGAPNVGLLLSKVGPGRYCPPCQQHAS